MATARAQDMERMRDRLTDIQIRLGVLRTLTKEAPQAVDVPHIGVVLDGIAENICDLADDMGRAADD